MTITERKQNLRTLLGFLGTNCFLTLCLGYLYVLYSPDFNSLLGGFFVYTALLSNFVQLYLILAVPFSILFFLVPFRRFLFGLVAVSLALFQIVCFVDIAIFRLYRIHINSMVLNLLTTEGAADTVHLGTGTLLLFGLAIAAIFALEFFLVFKIDRLLSRIRFSRRQLLIVGLVLVAIVLTDKTIYAVGDLYNVRSITRHNKTFPLYQIVTIKSFMRKHFDFELDRENELDFDNTGSGLQYSQIELAHEPKEPYPNIVWIMIDAWRFDMLNKELTPHISEFASRSLVYQNHFSGGNATRFGVFSLFYGIHAYYWHQFLGERQSPLLIDYLLELGYDFRIIASTKLTYPEFRKTCFVRIPNSIIDTLEGEYAADKDPKLTTAFLDYLDTRDSSRPFFSFLFYDAPHGPYIYPDEFDRLQPSLQQPNYLTMDKDNITRLKNGYMNAIYFDDFEVGRVLRRLEEKNLLENTIVLITSDHGEEFYESGAYGHTNAFSKWQTQVPLVLYVPGREPDTIDYMTSHLDIVPTMLTELGFTTDPAVYSQGKPLLTDPKHKYVVSSGWDDCGIIGPEYVLVFSFETYNLAAFEVRTADYATVENYREVLGHNRSIVLEVLKGFKDFAR